MPGPGTVVGTVRVEALGVKLLLDHRQLLVRAGRPLGPIRGVLDQYFRNPVHPRQRRRTDACPADPVTLGVAERDGCHPRHPQRTAIADPRSGESLPGSAIEVEPVRLPAGLLPVELDTGRLAEGRHPDVVVGLC